MGNAGGHYYAVSGGRDVQVALGKKVWVVSKLRFCSWDGVRAGCVRARLVLELLSYLIGKAFCVLVWRQRCQILGSSVAVDACKKIVLLIVVAYNRAMEGEKDGEEEEEMKRKLRNRH